ncbi:MAG: V-type ATPase subunit [Clostridia bacterium]|nr:V-type ATPase subunit [Clostridia bacterium]MBQ4248490.1 V-type ATPase subunit [Clostridia bacterium]
MFEIVKYGGLLGKAAGVYAKRITSEQFAEMKQKTSAEEIVALLKSHKGYSEVLSEFSERDFDREALERKLSMTIEHDFGMLYRYTAQSDAELLKYFVIKNDVEQILKYVRLIQANRTDTYSYEPTSFITHLSRLEFSKFKTNRTLDEFIESLSRSQYYNIMLPYKTKDSFDYTQLEGALMTYLYKRLLKLVEGHKDSHVRKELSKFLKTLLDMKNFTNVLRCLYVGQDRQSIYGCLLPFSSDATAKQLVNSMINAHSYEEGLALLMESPYKKYFDTDSDEGTKFIESYYLEYEYKFAKKTIAGLSPDVSLVVAYLVYKDLEVKNIIHLIEAKSYNLTSEETERFFVGSKKAG